MWLFNITVLIIRFFCSFMCKDRGESAICIDRMTHRQSPYITNMFMMCANDKIHYDLMVVLVYLHITLPHYHHYANLSESIEFVKCLSGTFCLECVSKIKSIIPIICHAIYGAVHIQLTHFSYHDNENTCTLSYYHHHIGCMTHLPLSGPETMVCTVCLFIFLYEYKYDWNDCEVCGDIVACDKDNIRAFHTSRIVPHTYDTRTWPWTESPRASSGKGNIKLIIFRKECSDISFSCNKDWELRSILGALLHL